MTTISLTLNNEKINKLNSIAKRKGESPDKLISEIIDEFLTEYDIHNEMRSFMNLSEPSFNEWDNNDDTVYDNL